MSLLATGLAALTAVQDQLAERELTAVYVQPYSFHDVAKVHVHVSRAGDAKDLASALGLSEAMHHRAPRGSWHVHWTGTLHGAHFTVAAILEPGQHPEHFGLKAPGAQS